MAVFTSGADRAPELSRLGTGETSLRPQLPLGPGRLTKLNDGPPAQDRSAKVCKTAARSGKHFTRYIFRFAGERYAYRLSVPESPGAENVTQPRPLVVLLHGCQQDAVDFTQSSSTVAQTRPCTRQTENRWCSLPWLGWMRPDSNLLGAAQRMMTKTDPTRQAQRTAPVTAPPTASRTSSTGLLTRDHTRGLAVTRRAPSPTRKVLLRPGDA